MAMLSMGMTEADCLIKSGLTEVDKKKLMLADNRIYGIGEDDMDSIEAILKELDGDLDIPGIDDDFLSQMDLDDDFGESATSPSRDGCDKESINTSHNSEPPSRSVYTPVYECDVDEADAMPTCKHGDIWQCGEHYLLCGDSTNPKDMKRLMSAHNGNIMQASMIFTDPPWNVGVGTDNVPCHRQRPAMANDNLSDQEFSEFLSGWMNIALPYLTGDMYCVMGASEWPTIDRQLREHSMHWSATVIWVKDSFVLGRSNYHRRYEPVWYGWRDDKKSSYCKRRDLDDVWEIDRPKRSDEHPTMKPVELVARAIENSSCNDDLVLDPFGGSGTTMIACEQIGRQCRMMEIEPHYCDVIIHRWETLTGQTAKKINS